MGTGTARYVIIPTRRPAFHCDRSPAERTLGRAAESSACVGGRPAGRGARCAMARPVMTSPLTAPPASAAVLLVDDRPENLLALEAVLAPLAEETGVRLLRAGGADEALRHVLHEDGTIAV